MDINVCLIMIKIVMVVVVRVGVEMMEVACGGEMYSRESLPR